MKCCNCGSVFSHTGKARNQLFCSRACRLKERRKHNAVFGKKKCVICKKLFQPKRYWNSYCSVSCRHKGNWRRNGIHKRYAANLPQDFFSQLLLEQNGRCALCNEKLSLACSLDHIIPLAEGGTTAMENLQVLCKPCNHGKYMFSIDEYIEHCKKVIEHTEQTVLFKKAGAKV